MSVKHIEHSIRNQQLINAGIEPPSDWSNLEQVRNVIKKECGIACSKAIYTGIEIDGKKYSLTEHDQTELMAQYQTVKDGAVVVPYHADGELCRLYPADEFVVLMKYATSHVFYHRTYCNHLNAWIARTTLKQLNNIYYGAELPKDLKESMEAIITATGGEIE